MDIENYLLNLIIVSYTVYIPFHFPTSSWIFQTFVSRGTVLHVVDQCVPGFSESLADNYQIKLIKKMCYMY